MLVFDQLNKPDRPLRRLAMVLLSGLLVLLAGLWYVQVLSSRKFAESLEDQAVRTVRLPAVRGRILDRNGVALAENRPVYNLELYLAELGKQFQKEYFRIRPAGRLTRAERDELERRARYQVVSNITQQVSAWLQEPRLIDERHFHRHYLSVRALPIPILENLRPDQVARFAERPATFPGLELEVQPVRRYPHGMAAAHLLGTLKRDDSSQDEEDAYYHYRLPDWQGLTGVELHLDSTLRGLAGTKSMMVNRLGYRQSELILRTPEPGDGVVLTIDLALQQAVERALRTSQFGAATRGAAVVLDVQNGDILAMASAPAFEPAQFLGRIQQADWEVLNDPVQRPLINRATQENYHPGSIFKILTALAALEQQALDPAAKIWNPGYFQVNAKARPIDDTAPPGEYDFRRAFSLSSNTYFITHGLRRGVLQRMVMLGEKLHLGERTKVLIRQETAGHFPGQEDIVRRWTDGETANLSIGQGPVSVSPLQMAVMTAAIVNGGKVFWPRLVARLEPGDTPSHAPPTVFPAGRVRDDLGVNPRNLEIIREAMVADVQDARGTGHAAWVPGLKIGGKTGTAQIERAGKIVDKTAWFVSAAPMDEPKWAVVVMVESGSSGGKTCAPIARLIYQALLQRERELGSSAVNLAGRY